MEPPHPRKLTQPLSFDQLGPHSLTLPRNLEAAAAVSHLSPLDGVWNPILKDSEENAEVLVVFSCIY
ncbi:hypothetical protein GQ457_16G006780 [Hibiscus cannabinus]